MPPDSVLVNLTVGLAFALVGGFLAAKLRLPAIVGYLVAGVAVGPHTPGPIANAEIAGQLAEIGVVLLMFGVGVHFSLQDILAVRGVAAVGAITQMAALAGLGGLLAPAWGWSPVEGLLLGLAISWASTVVVVRLLADLGPVDAPHSRIAIGWLLLEDLVAALVLLLLPALATPRGGSAAEGALWLEAALTLGKAVLLGVLMLLVGTRAIPWLLVQVARAGSRELFTLAVLAVALGTALGSAALFGVSLALGAFLAGLVVSESDLSHQVAAEALPLRDAFAVLFFVSVGMLVNPWSLLGSPGPTLWVLALIVLVKPITAALVLLAFAYPVRTVLAVAASRGQIGEFSFLLAEAARHLGLLPPAAYDLVIGGALLSITLNPLLFRGVGPLEGWVRGRQGLSGVLARRARAVATVPEDPEAPALRGHAVLCGYGRVGSVIGRALERRGLHYAVIELERRLVEEARRRGIPALYGDAANEALLRQAGIERCRVLIVAIPDLLATRQIVGYARGLRSDLEIVARTHTPAEWAYLTERVSEAVLGERELAIEMAGYALRRFGVSPLEVVAIMRGLRQRG